MDEILKQVITAVVSILTGGVGVACIAHYGDRWKFKAQRKAQKEDLEAKKADRSEKNGEEIAKMQSDEKERNVALEERLEGIETQITDLTDAIRLILFDRLVQFGEYLVNKGEITFDQRHRFGQMYDEYHVVLHGNGDADFLKAAVDKLPMKYSEGEKPSY